MNVISQGKKIITTKRIQVGLIKNKYGEVGITFDDDKDGAKPLSINDIKFFISFVDEKEIDGVIRALESCKQLLKDKTVVIPSQEN